MSMLNERIADVVANTGLTKTKFAEKINISQPYLSQLCSGAKLPSDRTITDICREFRVDEVWLRTGVGEMHPPVSRTEEIANFLGELLNGGGTPEQRAFIAVMQRTTQAEWAMFSRKLRELAAECEAAEKENGQTSE